MLERKAEAINLIQMMIDPDPEKRPSAATLLSHVFFWSNDKKLKIIQDLSDRLEFNINVDKTILIKLVEEAGKKFQIFAHCNNKWQSILHPSIVKFIYSNLQLDE